RIAGNRGERIFEFVRDAGGKFAERGEIFLQLHLLLQCGELRQIAEQANRPAVFFVGGTYRRNRYAEPPRFSGRSSVIDLLAAKNFALCQALTDELRQFGVFAEHFAVTAIAETAYS